MPAGHTPSPFSFRPRALLAWARALQLAPLPAALVGGGAGLLVGAAMAITMRASQVISARYQDWIAAAGLLILWGLIGLVAGLTVLAPLNEDADPAVCDTADASGGRGANRA